MATGVLYVMSTVVPGLVKIGKTATDRFDDRMYVLERNGYNNVAGLQRRFAIEVEDYDEKERMLDDIFAKARVPGSELFALNIDLAVELLSSFEGRQIFPKTDQESKQQVFDAAAREHREFTAVQRIPDGVYFLTRKRPPLNVEMTVEDGALTIRAGQRVAVDDSDSIGDHVRALRHDNIDPHGVVLNDVRFSSPSQAGAFATGHASNGWAQWKTKEGNPIDQFRAHGD